MQVRPDFGRVKLTARKRQKLYFGLLSNLSILHGSSRGFSFLLSMSNLCHVKNGCVTSLLDGSSSSFNLSRQDPQHNMLTYRAQVSVTVWNSHALTNTCELYVMTKHIPGRDSIVFQRTLLNCTKGTNDLALEQARQHLIFDNCLLRIFSKLAQG